MKKQHSLTTNALFSGFKSILNIVFPLITYKYASIVLGASNIGHVEYAKSIVSYAILVAGLGINSFAIRNGSIIRNRKADFDTFASRIFGLNCLSASLALVILGCLTFAIPVLNSEWPLILIFSFEIPLITIGVDWVFNIFEDFKYITMRIFFCQLIAIVLMVLLVKDAGCRNYYAAIIVFASYGANIIGFIYARNYCSIKPQLSREVLSYMPTILLLFVNAVATTIYVNSDITMLGIMVDKEAVGLYSASVKIYTAFKTIIATILTVALPKLTYYLQNQFKKEYLKTEADVIKALMLVAPAAITGLIMECRGIILLVSGEEFLKVETTMIVLSIALVFSTIAMLCGSTVLLPGKKEKSILYATLTGASFNVLLNLILLPKYSFLGAAVTTLISEALVAAIQLAKSFDSMRSIQLEVKKDILAPIAGCAAIVGVCSITNLLDTYYLWKLLVSIACSVLVYSVIVLVMKNNAALAIMGKIKQKFFGRR